MHRYKFKYSHHKGMLAEEIMRHHRRPDDTALNLLMERYHKMKKDSE